MRIRQRELLIRIQQVLSQELDMDTLLWRVIEMALDLVGGESGFVALFSDANGFQIHSNIGLSEPLYKYIDTYLAASYKQDDNRDTSALLQINMLIKRIRSMSEFNVADGIGLPLESHGRLIGIIVIFRSYKVNFTMTERTVLKSFTNQVSIAINNAFLYQENLEEKNSLNALVDATADGIAVINISHRVERINPALRRILGTDGRNPVGMDHDEVFRFETIHSGIELDEAEAGGWPLSADSRLTIDADLFRMDGEPPIPVSITYTPVMSGDGRIVNIIALVRDITKFREAENLKNTFISTISHELKTPVAIIKGYASTLNLDDADWDPAVVKDSLTVIEEEADRLTAMINNLLDASRITSGVLKLRKAYFDIVKLCESVAERMRRQTKRNKIVCEFPDDFPMIYADEDRIEQVITNLISNALKYAPEGTIRIYGSVEENNVTISVSDEGQGMSSEDIRHVFERFFRAKKTSNSAKGTGLGLYLCDAIIKAHNGRMHAEKRTDRSGMIFSFTLPVTDEHSAELDFH